MHYVDDIINKLQEDLNALNARREHFRRLEDCLQEKVEDLGTTLCEYSTGFDWDGKGIHASCYIPIEQFMGLIRPLRRDGAKLCSFAVSASELGYTVEFHEEFAKGLAVEGEQERLQGSLMIKARMSDQIKKALRSVGAIVLRSDTTKYETVQCPEGVTEDVSEGLEGAL